MSVSLESLSCCAALVDKSGRVFRRNEAFEKLFESSSSSCDLNELKRDMLWSRLKLSQKESELASLGLLEKVKKRIWVESRSSKVWIEIRAVKSDGNAVFVEIVDVDEREKALERVKFILETSFDGFWDWWLNEDYEFMSPAFWKMFGYAPEEKEHKPSVWMDMINGDDLKVATGKLEKHIKTHGTYPYNQEVRYTHKNGSIVWVRCKGRVVEWADDGSPIRMIGTHTDITKLKEQVEESARQRSEVALAHEELRNLIRHANAPIFGVNLEGSVTEWNDSMAKVTKTAREEALNRQLVEFAANRDAAQQMSQAMAQTLSGEQLCNLLFQFLSGEEEDSRKVLLVNTTARKDLKNHTVGVFCLAQDVTELMEAREIAIREGERASAESDLNLFLAHEVRNPLAAALSSVKFAHEKVLSNPSELRTIADDLDVARTSMEYIRQLLTNLMDLTRNSASPLQIYPVSCSIREDVLKPILRMLSRVPSCVELNLSCNEPLYFEADRLRLQQVILNICANSIKFTSHGFVEVSATIDSETREVVIAVSDSGPGIPEEFQKNLFQKYAQVAGNEMRGNGVGLCLSKELVERMGGELTLDTNFCAEKNGNKGCRFVVRLPLVPCQDFEGEHIVEEEESASKRMRISEELLANCKMLVVDDDKIVRMTALRILKRICPDWTFVEACSGEEGISLLEKAQALGEPFDLVLMDHFMPLGGGKLTGAEAMQIISAQYKSDHTVLIGMSGNDLQNLYLESGARIFWTKPFPSKSSMKNDLIRVLNDSNPAKRNTQIPPLSQTFS